jgi:RecA/RadA recombinase
VPSAFKLVLAPELAARLVSADRLAERQQEAETATRRRRSTGVGALDELLGGGWPRAALSEISGRRSSGRTAVVLAALGEAIAAGEAAALVDTGGSLDPRAAAACGVALPALLWIRCAPDQALKAADLVLGAGGFGLCAIDLCDVRLRVPDAAWVRLEHAARAQGTTVLVAASARSLGTFASAAVELGNGAPTFLTDGPPLWAGLQVRAARVRDRRPSATREPSATQEEGSACVSLAFTCRS